MIGKAGAESFLTFQQSDRLEGAGLLKKLKLLLFYAPLFIITAIFRVGTLGVLGGWDRGAGVGLRSWEVSSKYQTVSRYPLALIVPILALFTLSFTSMTSLTVRSIIRGVMADLTSLSMWAGNRRVVLGMATYLLLLYSSLLIWVIVDPTGSLTGRATTSHPTLVQRAAIFCLSCGWLSYPAILFHQFRTMNPVSIRTVTISESSDRVLGDQSPRVQTTSEAVPRYFSLPPLTPASLLTDRELLTPRQTESDTNLQKYVNSVVLLILNCVLRTIPEPFR